MIRIVAMFVTADLQAGIHKKKIDIYPLNDELNPIWHLQTLLGAHHILHVFRIMVKFILLSKSQKNIMQYK